jgi:hypothetical protein
VQSFKFTHRTGQQPEFKRFLAPKDLRAAVAEIRARCAEARRMRGSQTKEPKAKAKASAVQRGQEAKAPAKPVFELPQEWLAGAPSAALRRSKSNSHIVFKLDDGEPKAAVRESSLARSYEALGAAEIHCLDAQDSPAMLNLRSAASAGKPKKSRESETRKSSRSAMELDLGLRSARKSKKSQESARKPSRSVSLGALKAEPPLSQAFSKTALPPLATGSAGTWTLGPLMFGTPRQSGQGFVWSLGSARKRHSSTGAGL